MHIFTPNVYIFGIKSTLAGTEANLSVRSGAGAGIARKFAHEGYKIALVSRRQESIAPIEQDLRSSGAETLSVPSDAGELVTAVPVQV